MPFHSGAVGGGHTVVTWVTLNDLLWFESAAFAALLVDEMMVVTAPQSKISESMYSRFRPRCGLNLLHLLRFWQMK